MSSSLPPAEQARRDSALFEKMKCIFSIAPVEKLEKSRESPDAGPEAPDAVPVRLVCRQCLAQLGLGTGRQALDAGYSLLERPVF